MAVSPAAPALTANSLASAYTYQTYRQLIDDLLAQGKSTGPKQSEELAAYSALNVQRMQRLDKTMKVQAALAAAAAGLREKYLWLIITEGWCGDAAQLLPILEALAQASQGRISTRYVLRDEHPELMDQYLTGGGRAMPKLLVLHPDTLAVITHWGPRPAPAQELVIKLKAEGATHEEFSLQLHTWYAHDRTQTTQTELLALVQGLE